jgi:hypothetical protein
MDLFPTIDVTLAKKTKAVWALCKRFHYKPLDENDNPIPEEEWVPADMLAFYNQKLVDWLKRVYAEEHRKDHVADYVPSGFDD